jgi:hypothetical protein
MKKFKYIGQQSHNSTIMIEKGGKKIREDLRLSNGDEMELPSDHPVIKGLVDAKLLVEVDKQNSTLQN